MKCIFDMRFGVYWNHSTKCIQCKLWEKCRNKFKELFGAGVNNEM